MKKRIIIIYSVLTLLIMLPFFYILYAYNISYNLFRNSGNLRQPLATVIYDRDNRPVTRLYDEYRNYVGIGEIPETVIKAFLAAEDSSFYKHTGFDLAGIARALFTDVVTGELKQGGSTITQQLAKLIFAGREKSIRRKLVELFLSREFEKNFSKDKILEMYLNQIYLGHGIYGVSAGAEFYFQKSLSDIDIVEAALLAGIPSAPEKFSPLKNPLSAHDRSLGILFNLIASGYLDKKTATEKFNSFWDRFTERIKTDFPEAGIRKEEFREAPWFIENIRRELIAMYGEEKVYRGGLKVFTTLESSYQKIAEEILEKALERQNVYALSKNWKEILKIETEFAEKAPGIQKKDSGTKKDYIKQTVKFNRELFRSLSDELVLASTIAGNDIPASLMTKHITAYENLLRKSKAEGAIVAIDPQSGEILALVGGSAFSSVNQLNRAVQSKRQPGSAFKAFVYGAAIEEKKISAATPFFDLPLIYRGGKKSWAPSNYDRDYSGRVLARRALSMSLNIVSAKIYDVTGGDKIAKLASKLTGADYQRFQIDPTLSLGTTELTPLEIAKGFAVYANEGISVPVISIKKVEDRNGKVIFDASEKSKPERVISKQAAFIITSMMRDVINSGTASYAVKRAAGFRLPCAGKTGTNTEFRDAWFIGYTPDLVTAVWMGCESPQYSLGYGQSGAAVSAPVWGSFMKEVYRTRPAKKFPAKPAGVSVLRICSVTGSIADRGCPSKTEYFIPGTGPSSKCDGLHGKLSNIKELINREKKKIKGDHIPGFFEDKKDKEEIKNNSEESFFFDD